MAIPVGSIVNAAQVTPRQRRTLNPERYPEELERLFFPFDEFVGYRKHIAEGLHAVALGKILPVCYENRHAGDLIALRQVSGALQLALYCKRAKRAIELFLGYVELQK